MIKIFDISPEISKHIAVFPGDVPFERNISFDFTNGENLLLSSINSTLHLGAHADAPNHYHPKGEGIASRDLHYYLGPTQVIKINIEKGKRIVLNDIKHLSITKKRLLFCTDSFKDPNNWNSDFNSLSVEIIEYLHQKGVILVGIDTPSIDPENCKDLLSHNAIYKNNMAILEGLVLNHIPEGIYTLVALPLKIKDADASPVRAILIEGEFFNG